MKDKKEVKIQAVTLPGVRVVLASSDQRKLAQMSGCLLYREVFNRLSTLIDANQEPEYSNPGKVWGFFRSYQRKLAQMSGCLVFLFFSMSGFAAEPAHLRAWMAFPFDENTIPRYTLAFTSGEREGVVFNRAAGYGSTSFGSNDFLATASGHYEFRLLREGENDPERIARLEAELLEGHAYTLLATTDAATGRPVLRLIQEHPSAPEHEGLYIYNLLPEPELFLTVGESTEDARRIPASNHPLFLPAASINGSSFVFHTRNLRGRPTSLPVEYRGGRQAVVFIRNMYNQPTLALYDAIPALEEPDPDPEEEQEGTANLR